jgi:hypothetical protein
MPKATAHLHKTDFRAHPEHINRKGRPTNFDLKSILKRDGLTGQDIITLIRILMKSTTAELAELHNDPSMPIFIKHAIKAINTDYQTGRLQALEILLNRAYGKAQERIDHTTNGDKIDVVRVEIINKENK